MKNFGKCVIKGIHNKEMNSYQERFHAELTGYPEAIEKELKHCIIYE